MFASANADGVLISAGTTTSTHDLAAPLAQILADGSATSVYGAGSERLRAVDGPWYLGDALGSVRTTLDDAGAVVATTSYDPWGGPQGALLGPTSQRMRGCAEARMRVRLVASSFRRLTPRFTGYRLRSEQRGRYTQSLRLCPFAPLR